MQFLISNFEYQPISIDYQPVLLVMVFCLIAFLISNYPEICGDGKNLIKKLKMS